MKIEDALNQKKQELEEMQKDIDSLEDQAIGLKDTVKKYNELKGKAAAIKKEKRFKQKEFETVLEFFQVVDNSYVDKIYPLFGQQNEAAQAASS